MAKIKCEKCGKVMEETQFYQYRTGDKTEMCKKCMTMHIDNYDPETFLWLLEKMDVPYVEAEWNILRDRAFQKNPQKMNGMSVFGKYLAKMCLSQWRKYHWADTQVLAEQAESLAREKAEADEQREELLREQLEQGAISEAQYRTMTSAETQKNEYEAGMLSAPNQQNPYAAPGAKNYYDETQFISEDELDDPGANLTHEDKIYLAMKWGRQYTPAEWITMEQLYEEMMQCFSIEDVDSKSTLILMCKTTLKANQAIDDGDIESYQKLSKVLESQRKTAKWTAQQNKEDKSNVIDSIGALIAMCEKEGGFIPRYVTDIPQDSVDFTLRDQKNYIYKLVTEDLGFGNQIENALKKIEIQKQLEEEERKRAEELGDDYNPFDDYEDPTAASFIEDIEEELGGDE